MDEPTAYGLRQKGKNNKVYSEKLPPLGWKKAFPGAFPTGGWPGPGKPFLMARKSGWATPRTKGQAG